MTIEMEKLKPFAPRRRGTNQEPDDPRLLEAAQDAGVSLKIMRKAVGWSLRQLSAESGLPYELLRLAESGQLVERTEDGRLIDAPAAILVLVARVTRHESIPLPPS